MEQFSAVGLAPRRPGAPCFAIRLFHREGSNALWSQAFAENDTVKGFDELAPDWWERARELPETHPQRIGGKALYGFLTKDQRPLIGSRTGLVESLRTEIPTLEAHPNLRSVIARFIGDQAMEERAERDANEAYQAAAKDDRRGYVLYEAGDRDWVDRLLKHLVPAMRARDLRVVPVQGDFFRSSRDGIVITDLTGPRLLQSTAQIKIVPSRFFRKIDAEHRAVYKNNAGGMALTEGWRTVDGIDIYMHLGPKPYRPILNTAGVAAQRIASAKTKPQIGFRTSALVS